MGAQPDPLIVIVGETASGKTALALDLAELFLGEIICADSRTVYRGMDIGTAKPSPEERAKIPHHLLDVVDPDKRFSAADFKHLATEAIEEIHSRGRTPIMVGGTGLYIDAVLFDYSFAPHGALRDPDNPRHLDKAVSRSKQPLRANTLVIGLRLTREILQQRIKNRVDAMIDAGLIDEVKIVVGRYGWSAPALQAPGYKALREYIEGCMTLDEAKALFVKNDLNLAKRQRTWFKRNDSIQWINHPREAVDIVTTFLNKIQL